MLAAKAGDHDYELVSHGRESFVRWNGRTLGTEYIVTHGDGGGGGGAADAHAGATGSWNVLRQRQTAERQHRHVAIIEKNEKMTRNLAP